MPNRPPIPAEVQREVLIEAGHQCAVCGADSPLEFAHIVAWSRTKDHSAENLVCLCASCHQKADINKWGTKTLRQYKKKPWIRTVRQPDSTELPGSTSRPEIDDRLERLEEFPSLRPPDSEAEIRDMKALGLEPEPDHMDTVWLRVRTEIDPPLLDIECTAPIYSASCIYHIPGDELVMTVEPVRRDWDRILMSLGGKPLPAGTGILLKLFSPAPLRVRRIAIGKR